MNHNVTAGTDAEFSGTFTIILIWIGNVKRTMKPAVFLAAVNRVETLGSLVIAFALLGRKSAPPDGNCVCLNYGVPAEQHQSVLFL